MWKEKVFKEYKKMYSNIFDMIYPAMNSTGFPERNLSVNFAKAYERNFKNAVTWYELQFGKNNNNHIDAIVIDKVNEKILLIESKRFSNPIPKIKEINEDIDRIYKVNKELQKENRISDISKYKVFGVVLADVWMETKNKIKIFNEFKDGTFIENELPKWKNKLNKLYYNIQEFNNEDEENYKLVSFTWEL